MSTETTERVSPAVAAHRAAAEWGELRDLLDQAKGRADALGAEADAALDGAFVRPDTFRELLTQLWDDAHAAEVVAASRAAAAQDREDGR